jgi:type I restriction enzyme S subunit
MGDHPLGFSAKAEIREAFDESDLRWKVDIVDWHDLAEDFRRLIDGHKVRLQ